MQLRLQLQTIKKGGLSMMDYTLKVKTLADQLAAIQEHVSDRDLVLYLLAGLGADYNSFIVSVTSKSKALSFAQVSSLLLGHESRLEHQLSADENTPVIANVAQRNFHPFRGSGSQRHPSYRGFSNSSQGRGFNRPPNTSSNRIVCQLCLRSGHSAFQCYRRFDPNLPPPNTTTTTPSNPSPSVMVATPSTIADDSWLLDTGASHHLTPSSDVLDNPSPHTGFDNVTIGNGNTLSINSAGSSILSTSHNSFKLNNVYHVPEIATNPFICFSIM